jgi:histone H2B
VTALLTSLNLQQYIGAFVANDIVTMPRLKSMQESHFRMLGVSLGHQFDIVNRIQSASNSIEPEFPVVGHLNAAAIEPTASAMTNVRNKKKKRSRYQSFEWYVPNIHRVFKQIHPDKSISQQGLAVVNSIVNYVLVRIASEAGNLTQYKSNSILTSREIQIAVRLLLPGALATHAVKEGNKAMNRYIR